MTRARAGPAARLIAALAASLRERAVCGPDAVAVAVGRALRVVVHASRAPSVEELHAEILAAGRLLSEAQRGGEWPWRSAAGRRSCAHLTGT